MSRSTVALALFALFFTAVSNATGETPVARPAKAEYELTADSVEYDSARKVYVARGNARIASKDTELTADWMAFNEDEARGVATGNVEYRTNGDVLRANFVEFDIDDEQGVLFKAHFVPGKGDFRIEGDVIEKHDDGTYSIEKGMFTSCQCPEGERDPWQIHTSSADLEVGGYATARNTTLEIMGLPVVWLPWMIYPVKTERETGFLLPEFEYGSRNGVSIGVPFFWAVTEGLNVTATPSWLQDRGYKADVDIEYVYGKKSKGEISGAFVYDTNIDPYTRGDPFGRERWEVHGKQDVHLPAGFRAKSSFVFLSDNEYLSDFREDVPADNDDRFLESNAFLGRSFGESGRFGANAALFYFDDLQNPDSEDRDRFLLQRLPTLTAAALPAPVVESVPLLSRLIPAFDFEYTYFAPRHRAADEFPGLPGAYYVGDTFIDTGIDALPSSMEDGFPGDPDPHDDDTTATTSGLELNGSYEEGEPLADDGSRIDFFPRLGMPFRLGDYVEVYPEVGWHQTLYDTHLQGSAERHLLTGRVDLRSRLSRTYGNGLVHIFEPRVGYAFVNDLGQNQAADPLFVPMTAVPQLRVRQLELRNVTNDGADRVRDANRVTVGMANRIYLHGENGRSDLVADFYASGLFHIDDGQFGDVFVGGRFFPLERTFVWANLGVDPVAGRISEALIRVAHAMRAGHRFGLSYRYLRTIPKFFEDFESSSERFEDFTAEFERINQIQASIRIMLTPRWSVYDRVSYSFEQSLLLKNEAGVEYTSKCLCWAGGVRFSVNRSGGFRVGFLFRLLGLGGPLEYAELGDMGLLDAL